MAKLIFQFFGSPCFKLNGAAVRIGRRKVVALAAYLAITGKRHSREKLADLFWPEYDHDKARSSLRRTISVMTKELGRFWFVIDGDTLQFIPHEDIWVDVVWFQNLVDQASSDSESMLALEKTVSMYTDPFLAGFNLKDAPDFEDWQFEQTEDLYRKACSVLEQLTQRGIDRREYSKAIAHAQSWVALAPLNETVHKQLIRLYCQTEQQVFAFRQYEKCQNLLKKELGIEPDMETASLVASIGKRPFVLKQQFSSPLTSLPNQSTRFIGRKKEIKALIEQLSAPETRLLTLTGAGGIGKTRLALEAAAAMKDRYPQGIFFIPLVDISSVENLVSYLITILELCPDEKSKPFDQLLGFLGSQKCLLVLDNAEHLPELGELVSKLMSHTSGLKVLVTSRARLMLEGEHLFSLSGLSFPGISLAEIKKDSILSLEKQYDAVALFLSGARRIRPEIKPTIANYHGICRICNLTQGMPLALILAAGWVEMFPPDKIADEIKNSIDFLKAETEGITPCHRSIRAVFDSSWNWLPKDEKKMFMKLSIFKDGFTVDAVSAVTGVRLDLTIFILSSLVQKSMLKTDPETGRFEIHPLLRQYTLEKFSDYGSKEEVMDAYEQYYLDIVHENENRLAGSEMLICRQSMDADFANIRQAWLRAVGHENLAALNRAVTGLYVYFDMHTRYHDGEALFRPAKELLLNSSGISLDSNLGLIYLCWFDMYAENMAFEVKALSSQQAFQEIKMAAQAWYQSTEKEIDGRAKGFALLLLGAIAHKQKQHLKAIDLLSLGLETNPQMEHSFWVTMRIGMCWKALENTNQAIRSFNDCYELGRNLGDEIKRAWSLYNIGSTEISIGNLEKAESCLRLACESFDRINAPMGIINSCDELGFISFFKGDFSLAATLVDQTIKISKDLNFDPSRYQKALALKGLILIATGDFDQGDVCLRKVLHVDISDFIANLGMAFLFCSKGNILAAEHHLKVTASRFFSVQKPQLNVLRLLVSASVAAQAGDNEKACELVNLTFHHPCCPVELLKTWAFFDDLVLKLKSRMTPEHLTIPENH
ncbi:MAG: hypothetical protein JEY79_09105 [Pseudodesulfovibrio sp.]|nr:hypothetical protein [Pseudodesulfovibrio sp.]